MASVPVSAVQRQIRRVARRLFLQTLLDKLVVCLAIALMVSAAWFLAQPYLLDSPPDWLRWVVAGSVVLAGAVVAVILAIVKAPDRLSAALLIDERFELRERVTTSLTLGNRERTSPAGQALLADVNERVTGLDVRSRFPFRLDWWAALVPVAAIVLTLVALFYEPTFSQSSASAAANEDKKPPANAAAIDEKVKELKKRAREQRPDELPPKSEMLQQLEEDLDKIANKPRTTKEEVRERVKELTDVEDEMKKQERQLADKEQAVKDQLKQMDRLAKKQKQEDGPAKDLDKALAQGNLKQAQQEMERLAKKLENNELSKEDQEKLAKQLEDIKDQLERLSRMEDEKERLKELSRQGELDPEALDRELDRLNDEQKKLEELEELARELDEAKEALKKGDCAEAGH
jgi:hypothetical protein